MTRSTAPLFRPFALGSLQLANRIVMAPMTRSFAMQGIPGDEVAAYYRRRAEHGVGLIITEGTVVNHPAAANDPNVPHFYGAAALSAWAKVVAEVHAVGGRIMPQLWHVGMVRKQGDLPNPEAPPVGPSGLFKPGKQVGQPMTEAEMAEIIAAFAQAAGDAQRLGFDGIEIHGAHGYLIDQFFWQGTNHRTDRYGGSLVARTRFAVEVVQACRRAVGSDFPIVLRFSQWKQQEYTARLAETPELLAQFLAPLVAAGVDIFHCSTRRFWEPEFANSDLNLAGWTKKLTGKPTITVGSVSLDNDMMAAFKGQGAGIMSLDALLEMAAQDTFDLVAVGRALIANPDWAEKVKADRIQDLQPYTAEMLRSLV